MRFIVRFLIRKNFVGMCHNQNCGKNNFIFETSCDETACALFSSRRGLLGERVYSQWRRHSAYGGVVPELAAREHLQRILPMADDLLRAHSPIRPTCLAYNRRTGFGFFFIGRRRRCPSFVLRLADTGKRRESFGRAYIVAVAVSS